MQAAVAVTMVTVLGGAAFYSSSQADTTNTVYEGIKHNHDMLRLVEKLGAFRDHDVEQFDELVDQIDALVFRWHTLTTLHIECDKHDGPDAYLILVKIRQHLADFIQDVSPRLKPQHAVVLQCTYDEISEMVLQLFLQIMKKCRNIDL